MPSPLPTALTSGLTDRMVRFVDEFVADGGRNQLTAAIRSGYAPSGAAAIASRLLRRPDVLAYLRHLVLTKVQADVALSMDVLRQLRDDLSAPAAVRRQAANDLLDRAGMLIEKVSTVNVNVNADTRTAAARATELMGEYVQRLAEQGLIQIVDPVALQRSFATYTKAAAKRSRAIDADYQMVDDDEDEAPEPALLAPPVDPSIGAMTAFNPMPAMSIAEAVASLQGVI